MTDEEELRTGWRSAYDEKRPYTKVYVALLAVIVIGIASFIFISGQLPAGEKAEEKIEIRSDNDAEALTQRFAQIAAASGAAVSELRGIDLSL